MGSTFNTQILVEKLAKLNPSQQSIETLSHWCIFHMDKAKQVVETWDRQFHSSPHEQRLPLLYLANDILQNSRRKGSEFVGEFWKVLPGALRDVIKNGDEFGKNAVLRLINIWEDRKVFITRGQSLKEEFLGRQSDNSNTNLKNSSFKLRPAAGDALDKIVSCYQSVYGGSLDEDALLSKCSNVISFMEKANKEIGSDTDSGKPIGSGIIKEFEGQQTVLRNCIDQLTIVESSRVNLLSQLREALQEQEIKLEQTRHQIQVAQSQLEQANSISRLLLKEEGSIAKPPSVEKSCGDTKSTAAAVAAKLTASTSSAQMLTYALSFLASEGVIGNTGNEASSSDFPLEKKLKLDQDHSIAAKPPPPPPSSPPPMPPLPPPMQQPYQVPQFMQTAGPINFPYSYGPLQPLQPPAYPSSSGTQVVNAISSSSPPANVYQGSEVGYYGQQQSTPPTMAPISRQ
ncbi:regulation of nuclear pre-mRNA domain-containing protein 1A-like [Impatiens glandulifera]|uniref:regulation of nuclear pre-mRNA domain-containing protein 1A-like n=1 Tax=Impatiens glandulifera TaxID=253017 RepID=UPI001FB18C53|nr:regulation of nuclear pre-mRNA domain-containing protein 1A-like [Impatiens glandulifera]